MPTKSCLTMGGGLDEWAGLPLQLLGGSSLKAYRSLRLCMCSRVALLSANSTNLSHCSASCPVISCRLQLSLLSSFSAMLLIHTFQLFLIAQILASLNHFLLFSALSPVFFHILFQVWT